MSVMLYCCLGIWGEKRDGNKLNSQVVLLGSLCQAADISHNPITLVCECVHTHVIILGPWSSSFFFLLKILFIYERHRDRERQRHRQREKQAPFREPDVGLDPGSPGSGPALKVALNHWATWATLFLTFWGTSMLLSTVTIPVFILANM